MVQDAEYWIERLRLAPHPEGGYYRQSYRSEVVLAKESLPEGFSGSRPCSTAIYFLLRGIDFSAFHRLRSDEMWHFYCGGSLLVEIIDWNGRRGEIRLGTGAQEGESPQALVRAGCWFASHLRHPNSFALVGCTVSPGFDFADFEMARRDELERAHPEHRHLIEQFTRL